MGFLRALGLERFSVNRLKPNLKMAEQRFGILNAKKANLVKTQKRNIAALLREGKEEKARIRVEHLIRMDFTMEAYELLALLCELLHERSALIASQKECPPDLREAMCTLIWASARAEVPELNEVARQLELKYGKEFAEDARGNMGSCANNRVVHKLGVAPPSAYLVIKYLGAIAQEHNVEWSEPELGLDAESMATSAMPGPSGFSVPVAPGSGLDGAYAEDDGRPIARPPPVAVPDLAGTVVSAIPPPVAEVLPPAAVASPPAYAPPAPPDDAAAAKVQADAEPAPSAPPTAEPPLHDLIPEAHGLDEPAPEDLPAAPDHSGAGDGGDGPSDFTSLQDRLNALRK
eukprot:CAMPEP_0119270548 /NCGR_PEP_ID=MMETSP1329-20130426/7508_1 /TAXON_ID=114041 /ORGANISM="Genus nov. species nov., Strain RCC1024" /LENGTH=345 /DNA_ID=CAMNT_0007270573 /DNA_START=188 /DNA_END=1225 /DNA_ORIENTATION=-